MNATPRYYDIKDAARCLGVAPSTLRYWESQGLVRASRDERNDYRRYALHDVLEAGEIAFYRQLGVPVRDLDAPKTASSGASRNLRPCGRASPVNARSTPWPKS